MYLELISNSRHNLPTEHRLPEEPAILQQPRVELLTQIEIPVLAFQETDIYYIHCAHSQELTDFAILKVVIIGFGYRLEARRCMVH